MANILDLITLGNLDILTVDADPTTGGGTNSPIGSFAIVNDGSGTFRKNSATATDWIKTVDTANIGNFGVSSLSGTANQITASASTGAVTVSISGTYVGQASITTLGTITTGVWNGTAIANANLANSTISGVSLGSNLFALTIGTGLTGSSYNGSGAITITIDSTVVTLTGAQTLTNKSIAATQLTGTLQAAQFPALTGEATTVAGALAVTLSNAAVIGKVLTGYVSGAGVISATDTILGAIQKLNGNVTNLVGAMSYQGTWNANTNTPTLTSSVGTKGYIYKVSVAGTTNLDGTAVWNVGDFAVFNGATWDKWDGIASEVTSVFGRVGAVVATAGDYNTSQVTENTNLYFTNARVDARVATYTGNVTLTGTVFTIGAAQVTNAMLVNSTISGVALGSNLNALTIGTGLLGTSYNGSALVTITIDSTVVTLTGVQTLTNKTLTAPTINGGTANALTGLAIRSTGTGAFDLTIANTENLTTGRTLTVTLNDAARVLNMGGNITTAGALTTAGAFPLTLTTTGATNVTLPTSGTLVNTAVTTLSSLSSIGTITTGIWNGTIISPIYGGTGINNGANTITLAGSLTTAGANPLTLTTTGTTNVTLPTSGTLVNTAVTTLSSLSSIGTITTGTWNGTLIGTTYGGTGTATTFTQGSIVFAGASGVYTQNNSNFFWDNTSFRLGINTTGAPATSLHVVGTTRIDPVTGVTTQFIGATVNTVDATLTTILTIPVASGTVILVEARVTCRKTGGAGTGSVGDSNAYTRIVKVKNVSGTLTASVTQSTFTDEDIKAFNVSFAVSGTNLLLQVLGAANDNVTWTTTTIVSQ